ncbi:MAG: hypothetical protein PUD92_05675 [Clostridiales bacterium]|nr:hypothetical protein [Clostridiales bacterium]
MRRNVSWICFFLTLVMMNISCLGYEQAISFLDFGFESESGLGQAYLRSCAATMKDGNPVIVACVNGSSADEDGNVVNKQLVEVVDVNTEKLINVFEFDNLTYTNLAVAKAVDPDYNVYMAVGRNILIYSPQDNSCTRADGYISTTFSGDCADITAPEAGVCFGIGNRYGTVFKIEDGVMNPNFFKLPDTDGGGGCEVVNGRLYAGGTYTGSQGGQAHIYSINPNDPDDYTVIPNPEGKNVSSIGEMYDCGNYLIVNLTIDGNTAAYFWDTIEEGWVTESDGALKSFTYQIYGLTEYPADGKLYYCDTSAYNYYHSIDTVTLEDTQLGTWRGWKPCGKGIPFVCRKYGSNLCYAQASYDGLLSIICPGTRSSYQLSTSLERLKPNLRKAKVASDGKLYMGCYVGAQGIQYNPETGEAKTFNIGQVEGITSKGNKVYLGVYPGAEIYEIDTEKDFGDSNPQKIYDIDDEQDRPFGMDITSDGKLLCGTLPIGGTNGGALTVIDTQNGYTGTTYRNIVPGQSLLTVTSKGNIAYCGTTVCGGAGSSPASGAAHVFSFDINSGELLNDTELIIPGVSENIAAVHGLKISPYDGKLYGCAGGVDFVMDPDTLTLERYNKYGGIEVAQDTQAKIWHDYNMEFSGGCLFRTNQIIDPETLEVVDSCAGEQFAGISNEKAYFVSANTDIYAAQLSDNYINGVEWNFDDGADLPAGFSYNNKTNIPIITADQGASQSDNDLGFGFGVFTGVYGGAELNRYSNGFKIAGDAIPDGGLSNTKLTVDMDFMYKNADMSGCLLSPMFTDAVGTGADNTFYASVTFNDEKLYAAGNEIADCKVNEWHNIGIIYSFSDSTGVTYDVYFDSELVAEGLSETDARVKSAVTGFRVLVDAMPTEEEYAALPRSQARNETMYVDNIYIGRNTDNVRQNSSFRKKVGNIYINGGAYGTDVTILNATYSDDRFVSVECDRRVVKPHETIIVPETAMKTFVWESLDSMVPIQEIQ